MEDVQQCQPRHIRGPCKAENKFGGSSGVNIVVVVTCHVVTCVPRFLEKHIQKEEERDVSVDD